MEKYDFAKGLAEYRRGLEWRAHFDDFMDSLGGRSGVCSRDAAEAYADETEAVHD